VASDEIDMRTRVGEVLNRWPTAGLAVGVVREGSLAWFHGHGVADVATNRPVTENTVFRIASITKTCTAIAVMQLWERGLVDLDAPASDYLRAYRLIPANAGFRLATLRQLLTHTAGVRAVRRRSDLLRPALGWAVPVGRPPPPLADYYRGGLRVDFQPGTRWAYSNHGFATLGQIVEDVSGMPLDRYLRESVFGLLGMESSDLIRSERDRRRQRGVLHHERHGSLRRGASRRRHQRARLRAQTRDARLDVRASLPARSSPTGHGPGPFAPMSPHPDTWADLGGWYCFGPGVLTAPQPKMGSR
jgi:CubicO group peptidase (beta-lactamase class C family)